MECLQQNESLARFWYPWNIDKRPGIVATNYFLLLHAMYENMDQPLRMRPMDTSSNGYDINCFWGCEPYASSYISRHSPANITIPQRHTNDTTFHYTQRIAQISGFGFSRNRDGKLCCEKFPICRSLNMRSVNGNSLISPHPTNFNRYLEMSLPIDFLLRMQHYDRKNEGKTETWTQAYNDLVASTGKASFRYWVSDFLLHTVMVYLFLDADSCSGQHCMNPR